VGSLGGNAREGWRLRQAGMLMFLLALGVGLFVPAFAIPRLGLATHLVGVMQGIFLMVLGLMWPKLRLARGMSRLGCGLALYGSFAAWTANLLAAIWGAGHRMMPLAAGAAQGTSFQENLIAMALMSAAVALIALALLVLWGLRAPGEEGGGSERLSA
jgi:hydroxylaminobenzene mutase